MKRRTTRRRRRPSRRRGTRGLGKGLKIFQGLGARNGMPVSLGIMLPPLVGGTGALGGTLLMRAFVPPVKKDDAGNVVMKADGTGPKLSPFFQYAGLFGAGIGVLASLVLGPFMGWGSALAGSLTSVAAGVTAQLTNMVVPKDYQQYRGLGRVVAFPHTRSTQARQRGPMMGYGQSSRGRRITSMSGSRGMGLVAVTDAEGQPGRTPNFIPENVLQQVNKSAFGSAGMY